MAFIYMVKFDIDHYLAVAKWSPEFVSSTAKIEKTMVWVGFPGMSLIYYDESRSTGRHTVSGTRKVCSCLC